MRELASMINGIFSLGAMLVRQMRRALPGCCVQFVVAHVIVNHLPDSEFGPSQGEIDAIWTNRRRIVPKISAHHDHASPLRNANTSNFF